MQHGADRGAIEVLPLHLMVAGGRRANCLGYVPKNVWREEYVKQGSNLRGKEGKKDFLLSTRKKIISFQEAHLECGFSFHPLYFR